MSRSRLNAVAVFFTPMFYWLLSTWSERVFGGAKPPAAAEPPHVPGGPGALPHAASSPRKEE